jgi:hypothetical protein
MIRLPRARASIGQERGVATVIVAAAKVLQ